MPRAEATQRPCFKISVQIGRDDYDSSWTANPASPAGAVAAFDTHHEARAFAVAVTKLLVQLVELKKFTCASSTARDRRPEAATRRTHWNKPFVITSVCRNDLLTRFSRGEVNALADDDMRNLARRMEELYVVQDFWDNVEQLVVEILEDREASHEP